MAAELDARIEAEHTPEVAQPPGTALLRAQAINCGGVAMALPFTWARAVVETFELSPAPNAPPWLVGAVNVDGHILPVLDVAAWLDASHTHAPDRNARLLVGGEGENQFALLFQGLPLMVRYAPEGRGDARAPDALAPYVLGSASQTGGQAEQLWPVIDARALSEHWINELNV
jgi:chemotaxis signal transduction protein